MRLADNTLILVKHNLDVIKTADCVIELGQREEKQATESWLKASPNRWRRQKLPIPGNFSHKSLLHSDQKAIVGPE